MIKSLILDGLKTRVEGSVMRISVGYRASGLQLASAPPSSNLPNEKRGEQRASHDATHFLMHFKSRAKRPFMHQFHTSPTAHDKSLTWRLRKTARRQRESNCQSSHSGRGKNIFRSFIVVRRRLNKPGRRKSTNCRPPRHVDATAIRSAARHLLAAAFLLCALPSAIPCTVKTAFIASLRPRPARLQVLQIV